MTVFIKSINILAFGHFENVRIDFARGFNLIYGNNESGKSTLTSFIEGVLYGFDEGKKVRKFSNKQKIYQPLGSYKYAGFAIFNKDGIDYRVSRNFATGEYEIYNLSQNNIIESKASNLFYPGEFLLGLDYDLYKSLIASYQMQENIQKAREKINEILKSSGDYNFSANQAIEILDAKIKEIGTERAYSKPYMQAKNELDSLTNELRDLENLRKIYYQDFKKLDKTREEIKNKTDLVKALRARRDSYRKNIAHQNLEDEIKYRNQLNIVDTELKKHGGFTRDIPAPSEQAPSRLVEFIFIGLAVVLTLISLYYKKYILIPLAILVPLLILLGLNKKNNNPTESPDTKYNSKDEDYQKYLKLSYEKEKLEEVLRVLANQDKTTDRDQMLEIASIDINEVEAKISRLESDLENLTRVIINLEKKLAAAEDRLKNQVGLVERHKQVSENLAEMEKQKEALELAIETIEEISNEGNDLGAFFRTDLAPMLAALTRGRYRDISYDKDLNPRLVKANGEVLELDKLSTGFIDQLNFAFKYKANKSLSESFLIFDDAFINYDMERLRTALLFLLDIGEDRQIIYLTCHRREADILRSEGIDFNQINLEEI